ncbi:DNA polymerase III PolC-type [Companilactobacillus sp. RD055328]|uniref:PolC-type DNA polymerase III n=1 Tax=Companilactobacillus sp. RD055328 TaxID=2916634 RepID=UPI001FC7F659|nr:PolC-type DNA polymerase III [Companilactobacillus sp. RD055328]GKQ42610.1 DNA polymerase III PolC-type [Companilactobacillus sp. RD055328]
MTDKNELFQILLKQIKIDEAIKANPVFDNGAINSVDVHEKSQSWTINFSFNSVLPFVDFQMLNDALVHSFKDIAEIKMNITTNNSVLTQKNVSDYWKYVLNHLDVYSPILIELQAADGPKLENDQYFLSVQNEVVKGYLEDGLLSNIQTKYSELGFPDFSIHVSVDETRTQEKIDELHSKNDLVEQKLQSQLVEVQKKNETKKVVTKSGNTSFGKNISSKEPITQMSEIFEEERDVTVQGYIFDADVRKFNTGSKLLTLKVTDYSSSFTVKKFSKKTDDDEIFSEWKKGKWARFHGSVEEDRFTHDLTIMPKDMNLITHEERKDTADEKRVELHIHTNMSQMDAIASSEAIVKRAADWGHKAVAVTDHATAQAFPFAYGAGQKNGIKILYGVEINLVDEGNPIAYNLRDENLKNAEYVIFDTETTGLSAVYDSIIEIGAVKMKDGQVIDRFDKFINPGHPLSETIVNLTSITDDMLRDADNESVVIKEFMDFAGNAALVGHNVTFDMGFMNATLRRAGMSSLTVPVIDTLEISRTVHSEYRNHKLDTLAKKYDIKLEHHHRADSDAETTGMVLYKMLDEMEEQFQTTNINQLNDHVGNEESYKQARPNHAMLLAQTQDGLKNMFKIVSSSMIDYFYRVPRVPRRLLDKYREGLLVGSACASGEVFVSMMQKGYEDALSKADYYDYIEIQPKSVYEPLVASEMIAGDDALKEIMNNIVKLGDELNKPVVATGDVHYLDENDSIYRDIVIHAVKSNPLIRQKLPDAHFRTTDEMLEEFAFMGEEIAHKIVVTNSNKIADEINEISPVKDKLYTPNMPGAEQEIEERTLNRAHELYGENLPEIVQARVDKELKSIIGNGFSVIYLISQRLVFKSNKDGYLVGSRGSVGSSFVATMTGITEVNPLPPHYRCPECHYSEFFTKGEYGSGYDLPAKKCPDCGAELDKDGQDIPFETFLGFKGDKVPDIDLNFSGDYQPVAHNYTKVMFGEDQVFRAGTIGTIADRTAFGYVKNYEEVTDQKFRSTEVERLAMGATGVKRTTGQHPAGILVVPEDMDIYDFTPIQYPANDTSASWKTTHFDFHSIHDNILKLDILGHDDPTMIRMLQDLSGIDPQTIPTNDEGVMKLFSGTESLGVTPEQIQSKVGTLGVPEFGTRFVRGMLEQTHPTTYNELLQISGLSHGTDVWLGNAEELIKKGVITLKDVIGCRDNIMTDLIHWGMESQTAFQIMESVRKGKGIKPEWQDEMRANDLVPDWYIDSCMKIKYMFPRAHATAYVLMALRIAYFKVHYPIYYYSAYFSVRADDFDLIAMAKGKDAVKNSMSEINQKGMDASTKEKNLLTVLEIANECLERGFTIKMVDLNESEAFEFKIVDDNTLLAPFIAIPGLGENVAKQIVAAREERYFLSKEDLASRGGVSKTTIEYLTNNHVVDDLPDENQLSLF